MKAARSWGIALIACASVARADLLEDVGKQVSAVKARRLADEAKGEKDADRAQKKAEADLAKAEAALKKAQELVTTTAKEHESAKKAKSDADARKKSIAAVGEAARSLAASAAAIKAGKTDVDLKKASPMNDPELRLAAQALAGMAAGMKGDDKTVIAQITPEVAAKFPSARRWLGMAKLHAGDKEGAFKELKAATIAPNDAPANAALGELAAAHGEMELAMAAWGAAYAIDPGNPDAALGLASALIATGHEREAIAPLTLLASMPGNKQAAYLLAFVSEKSGDRLRAEAALANLAGGESRDAKARVDPSYLRVGRPLRVVPVHDVWTTLDKKVDEAAAKVRLAWYRLQRGYPEAAAASLETVDRSDALYVRGLALLKLGRVDEAKAALGRADEREPNRAEIVQALGVALLEAGEPARAKETFAKAPADDYAIVGQAVALFELDKTNEAALLLSRVSRKSGVIGEAAATDLAVLKRAGGAPADALKIAPAQPKTPEGWMVRGLAMADKSDGKAAAAFRAAIELMPNYVDAHLALARALSSGVATGKELDQAAGAAQRALELVPSLVEPHAVLAAIWAKKGEPSRQAAELAKIRELGEKASCAAGKRHTLAVVTFENHTGDATLDWLKQGIPEALLTDLGHLGGIQLVERAQVQKSMQELKLAELGFADAAAQAKVGKLAGADALLVGQFFKDGADTIRLDGRVLEIGSNKILKTGSASGKLESIFDIERKLAIDLVAEYAAVTDRERSDFFGAKRPTLAALSNMSRIRMLSAQGKLKEAKAAYEKLLQEDPDAALKLKDLQKSWSDLAATVAVAPLKNVTGVAEQSWIGVGIAEALSSDLKRVGLYLVERQQIEWLMQERKLTEIVNPDDAVKLGKLAGASFLVIGSYQSQEKSIRIDARLVDVSSGQVLSTWSEQGRTDNLFEAEANLAKQIAQALKVEPSAVERAAMASQKPSLDDFKRYIQASSKLVVKEATNKEISVTSLAIAQFKDATGAVDASTTAAVKATLERDGRVPVRSAASADPKAAAADALIVGTITRSGDKVRIDARAVASASGEVITTATAVSSAADADASRAQVAHTLLSSLGLRKSGGRDDGGGKKKVTLAQWLPWTILGIVVVGTAASLGGYYGYQASQAHAPASDSSLTIK